MNIDLIVFGVYLVVVAVVGFMASRKEKGADDYFLAGRNLVWWIIGGSLIAANISTHHFIGMGGQGFSKGLAIASYEWIAAIALILYAKIFLPYYLKSRITTMPEFGGSVWGGFKAVLAGAPEKFHMVMPWYKSFGFWATVLVICVIALYVRFF